MSFKIPDTCYVTCVNLIYKLDLDTDTTHRAISVLLTLYQHWRDSSSQVALLHLIIQLNITISGLKNFKIS